MASNGLKLLAVALVAAMMLAGCQEPVVKAGVAPPQPNQESGRMRDKQGARGGLGLPKQLPKGPY
ncbi:MAG: hypothetical protein JSS65_05310 [Armatimonadetes bacterium]|nr:hypothetical protein [Armatimonadota bacterium]